jgi:hypothetical protein
MLKTKAKVQNDPANLSADRLAMEGYLRKVDDVLTGVEAMRARRTEYLPMLPNENDKDYDHRLSTSKLTNVFSDIVESLAAKPFTKEVSIKPGKTEQPVKPKLAAVDGKEFKEQPAQPEKLPDWLETFKEDVDARGNNLNVFAANVFHSGIRDSVHWLLVDYTRDVPASATIEQERTLGVRPWWVSIAASNVIAVYSAMIGGKEEFIHARIREDEMRRVLYDEELVERIRIFNREPVYDVNGRITGYGPATSELLEKVVSTKNGADVTSWQSLGVVNLTVGVIPLLAFITGRRIGSSWRFKPALSDALDLQIKVYQDESDLSYAKQFTAYGMLAANGINLRDEQTGEMIKVPVGHKAVLCSPPNNDGAHGEWEFISPDPAGPKFLAEDVKESIAQLRELGRQPLTAQTGNITVITAAFAGDKANSVIQAWTLTLKDTLENALKLTALWVKQTFEAEIEIDTDFDLAMKDEKGPDTLGKMREKGDLSRETYWSEMKRRGILSDNFDPETEAQNLMDEMPDEGDVMAASGMGNIDPATGLPMDVNFGKELEPGNDNGKGVSDMVNALMKALK